MSLHAVVYAIYKASLFHMLILLLLLLCTVKPVNIGHAENRAPRNSRYFYLERQVSTKNTYISSQNSGQKLQTTVSKKHQELVSQGCFYRKLPHNCRHT